MKIVKPDAPVTLTVTLSPRSIEILSRLRVITGGDEGRLIDLALASYDRRREKLTRPAREYQERLAASEEE